VKVDAAFTQAESVNELGRSSEVESCTEMWSSVPSKYIAFPTLPAVHNGPLIKVPELPLPEESAALDPVPSSNFQWATSAFVEAPSLSVKDAVATALAVTPLLKAFAFKTALAASEIGALYGAEV
jgi:hypothetical protein